MHDNTADEKLVHALSAAENSHEVHTWHNDPLLQLECRKSPRRYCSVLSEVLTGPKHTDEYLGPAIVVDVSEHGLGLQTDFKLPVGKTVYIRNRNFDANAIVRNSHKMEVGFRAGVEFTSKVRWTAAPLLVRTSRGRHERAFPFRSEGTTSGQTGPPPAPEGRMSFRPFIGAIRRLLNTSSGWLHAAASAIKPFVSPGVRSNSISEAALQRSISDIHMQHEQLDKLFGRFQATVGTSDLRLLYTTIDELASSMLAHFQHEERLMELLGYSDMRAHQWQHEMLLNDLELVRARLTSEHNVNSGDLADRLKVMIIEHVSETDLHFLNYCDEFTDRVWGRSARCAALRCSV